MHDFEIIFVILTIKLIFIAKQHPHFFLINEFRRFWKSPSFLIPEIFVE